MEWNSSATCAGLPSAARTIAVVNGLCNPAPSTRAGYAKMSVETSVAAVWAAFVGPVQVLWEDNNGCSGDPTAFTFGNPDNPSEAGCLPSAGLGNCTAEGNNDRSSVMFLCNTGGPVPSSIASSHNGSSEKLSAGDDVGTAT